MFSGHAKQEGKLSNEAAVSPVVMMHDRGRQPRVWERLVKWLINLSAAVTADEMVDYKEYTSAETKQKTR
ncbi:hypothetical protein PAMP_010068 [Pampus punctatissimus]